MMERDSVLPFAVTRVAQDFFNGALNDTVTMRVGSALAVARDYEWRTRTAPIVLDDITEGGSGIDVKLDTHCYSATALTDEQMTLDEINFARQVLAPQVEAVVGRLESKVSAGLAAANVKNTLSFGDTGPGADPHLVAIEARRLLDADKVAPRNGRMFVVGANIEAAWLASDRLARHDSTGQDGTPALRDAIIGRLAGAPVIGSNAISPNAGYYVHQSALILGNVAPVVPQGVVAGRTGISSRGLSVRWIQDYDPSYLRDRSIVSSFVGVNDVRDERDAAGAVLPASANVNTGPKNVRMVKLTFTGTASVIA